MSNNTRIIPLSVCLCSRITNYSNCYTPHLDSIFPGQTLNIELIISIHYLNSGDPITTLVVANTPDDECSILNYHQLTLIMDVISILIQFGHQLPNATSYRLVTKTFSFHIDK